MIDKTEFHTVVMEMQGHPMDESVRLKYFLQVQHLSEIIAKSYKVASIEDAIHDLIEYSIKKRLHERIKPDQNAFSYYWKSLSQHAWNINKNFYKDTSLMFVDLWEDSISDECKQEEIIMERLDWSLEDYNEDTPMEEVIVTKGKRGRPKTKFSGEKAQHWEYLFKLLKRKGTMTETALIARLPMDKQRNLKNPSKSVEYYMRQISRRDGQQLSISNNGKDIIYMVINND